jgi:two-component sensor histidine kinase
VRLFILTAVALVPALGILTFNEISLRGSREAEVRALALRFGELAALELDGIMSGAEGLLRAVARAPVVRTFDAEPCRAYLADVQSQSPHLTAISAIDREGNVRCRTERTAGGGNVADRPYFREAIETGQFVIGEYLVSRFSGRPTLPLAVPVKDEGGAIVGVVATGLNLDWLGARLRERDALRGSALTIADRNGVIIAREPFPERFIGTRIPDPFLPLVKATEPGAQEVVSQDGTRRIIGYKPAPVRPVGLYVSAGISREEALAPLERATRSGAVLALSGAVVAFLAAWFFGQRFVQKPVDRLVNTIQAWRWGDRSVRTGMSAEAGELESVGAAVDALMDELAVRQAAREQAEKQQRLLLNELNHRVKNTLATVQFISAQTLRNAPSPQKAQELLEPRLVALARAHDMLTRESWDGADLDEIVAQALEPYSSPGEDRVHFSGPDVRVAPRTALALSMAFQELATNAVKYGALSNHAGRVRITWTLTAEPGTSSKLCVRWEESGGPPVEPPSRRGFGSRLLQRALAQDIDGQVTIDFASTGVVCTVEAFAA